MDVHRLTSYTEDEVLGPLKDGRCPNTPAHTALGLDVEEYRVGGPSLPMLPVSFHPHPSDAFLDFDTNIRQALDAILRPYGIGMYSDICALQSLARPNAPREVFVYVGVDWYPECLGAWKEIADAMLKKLKELDRPGLKVMVADPRTWVSPLCEGLAAGDSLLPDWQAVANQIIDAVAPNTTWLAVDLLWRWKKWWVGGERFLGLHDDDPGSKSEPKRVKIVFLIAWDSAEDWDSTVSKVKAVINSFPVYRSRGVTLELSRGYLSDCAGPPIRGLRDSPYGHGEELWKNQPYIGASICPDNCIGAGTYGCTITLDDLPHVYGLTACHVVFPSSNQDATYANPTTHTHVDPATTPFLPTGASLGTIPGRPAVRMPAKQDLEAIRSHCTDKIAQKQAQLDGEFKHVQEMCDAGLKDQVPYGDLMAYISVSKSLVKHQDQRAKVMDRLDVTTGKPGILGEVRAFSGFRKDDASGMILDWALISLDPSKAPHDNELPDFSEIDSPFLTVFEDAEGAELVFKVGRSTGLTEGMVNAAHTLLKLNSLGTRVWPESYDNKRSEIRLSTDRAWAVAITSRERNEKSYFARPGDSGAVVFNELGRVNGLLVLGQPKLNIAYMTNASELVKDIMEKTGARKVGILAKRI